MIVALAPAEIESFRGLIAERLGLHFEDEKLDFLADVLRRRMEDTGCQHFYSYRARISPPPGECEEISALAEQLTVGETYFFRYAEHFAAFAEVVVPSLIQARSVERRLRVLSAGCASGEEPYSLAILLQERFPFLSSWDVKIIGFDINPLMIEKALRARYSSWSLRETHENLRERYFRREGRDLQLEQAVRSAVNFEQRNLIEEDPAFWRTGEFDAVFCRNVTMYLAIDLTRSAIARIARSLAPGGFLFLGHAETLRGLSKDFHLRHTHETFYYQRRELHEAELAPALALVPAAACQGAVPEYVEPDDTWYNVIRRASERVARLTDASPEAAAPAAKSTVRRSWNAVAAEPSVAWDRASALELLRKERFHEALEFLKSLPAEAKDDPDAQMLLAVLLANGGDLPEAEEVCEALLKFDELNAGAHYLMALCREQAGDADGAAQHDQAAAYLDPTFAMPHLHLGLLAKRFSNVETCQREFGRALPLLTREDGSRLLLFGGGFTREALIEFCRAELQACGGMS